MAFDDLKDSSNMMFPDDNRDWRQITTQLNDFQMSTQLLTSLSNFSTRYPWSPRSKSTAEVPGVEAPLASNVSLVMAKFHARERLDRDKKKINDYSNNQTAIARQQELIK